MLRFGTVTSINPKTARARVQFAQDSMTSYWLPVLQRKTYTDKFYSMPPIGEQVACLMDENSEDGVILGAIYTTEDVPIIETEQQVSANFEDGTFANVDKEPSMVWLPFESAAFAFIKACCLFSQRQSSFKVSPLTQFSFLAVAETTFPVFGFLYETETDL